MTLISKY